MHFLYHLAAYVVVMVVLIIINNIAGSENQWWIWPAIVWGMGIVGHFLKSFILSNNLEKKLIETELENIEEEDRESP